MKKLHDSIKWFRSSILAEYAPFLLVVAVLVGAFYLTTQSISDKKDNLATERKSLASPESISDTASSSESVNSGRYNTWDAETASSVYFESYAAMEDYFRDLDEEREKATAEYNKAIKGTVVEQIQNASIPSYVDENQLTQLQQGEILIKEPASEEFPDGISLWAANLEKNKNSFVVGDFNKDGLNDVAHIIGYTGFGSGYFYQLTIFINDHGKLKYLTQKELGDRVVIKSVKYNSGLFTVDMITQGEGDDFMGYCCPNIPATVKFKLESGQLVET